MVRPILASFRKQVTCFETYTDSYKNLGGKKFMCKIVSVLFMALSKKILMLQ